MKIDRIEQTCTACPSQWNIFLENGSEIYVRYRHGHLSIEQIIDERSWDTILLYEWFSDDTLDGVMETDEMLEHFKKSDLTKIRL